MTRINAHCRVPLAGSRVDHAGCGDAAFVGHLSELSHRAVFRSVGKIRVRRLHFCIERLGFLAGILDDDCHCRRHGRNRGAARWPARLPDGAHRRSGTKLSRAVDIDSDLRLGSGDRVRLCRGNRPCRDFLDACEGPSRLCAVESLFAAGADRDRGTYACPACLPIQRRCAAWLEYRSGRGRSCFGSQSLSRRSQRQPADDPAGDPVCRSPGVFFGF